MKASYKLPLKSLHLGNEEFNYHLDGSFFNEIEHSEVTSGSVDVALKVARNKEDLMELDFVCKGVITVPCDRCLDDMELPVDTCYHLTVKLGEQLDDSVDNVLEVPSHWRELDLAPLMRDTVLLTIPIMHCHDESDCNPEMMARLAQAQPAEPLTEPGDDKPVDNRWAALESLKGNYNN